MGVYLHVHALVREAHAGIDHNLNDFIDDYNDGRE
jgi:hypothetical protein